MRERIQSLLERVRTPADEGDRYWFTRYGKSIVFLILILAVAGTYLAFTIPISVFPTTNFPRVLIAVDNGVTPIDQMMVTITRPIEESVNSVPGLRQVRSITSRGSAEIDLFFDWHVDMVTTLQLVDAALANIRTALPATALIQTHRLTFASFPIIGYSLTSDTVPQTQLWTMATYELKPRLNRLDGVATVLVQGGQEPEFQITPDPSKLLTTNITVTDILANLQQNAANACKVVLHAVEQMPNERSCKCGRALEHALITDKKLVPETTLEKLDLIVGKYFV